MADQNYDAIVVGSGISGGWAAKELTEKGLKVLMLERGRNIEHIKDYVNANKEAWDFPHRGRRTQQMINDYPVLKRDYPLNETNLDYWVNEKESPYTEVKRFDWFRGYHVGGRSLMWGRQSYRWSDFDFEANAKDGIAVDWPVRYKDIEKWYTYVERFAGISGSKENLPQLPDSDFLPPMELNCVEKDLAKRLKEYYKNQRTMIIGRTANLTKEHEGRTSCQYRNKCWLGCPFGAYFSTQSSTLPAAMKTGNLTLRPWSIVTKVLYDKDKKRATGVEVLDAETNQTYTYNAKIIFLNASALNSAWILMNSATDIWPDGLGSSSGELGHNVMDHHLGVGAGGRVEGYEDKYYFGRRANGIYIPRYQNLFGDKRDYLRGFGYQGSASRQGWGRDVAELSIGADFKDALTEPGGWSFGMMGFGEVLPDHNNKITLDKNVKDKWGLPVLSFDCELKENELKMRKDMEADAIEMLTNAGVKDVRGYEGNGVLGRGIHEMGTARMGHDPKTSVVNKYNQVWDAPNVFVTDGAFMTSGACVNPSLTYMAFTARAADYAVSELKKQNL
ncbi:MAG: GMC family oxidoreductase [Sediminibacterium sp. Gen4]|jgi:choline dehydrogenase-like flavoprotein|uniref:GMC oxidoreductase n=1 Tax=unclassified Sediminibacterium TaxID=2635961 RepID=UPI0015B88239|nr:MULTISPECIES: GMC family oxidoreductase [unclassified Sediminibacterium]MBW0163978.1 GMC family oxidoreductase [Sediminibacterium sp.]NWK65903.1 GMC family oxidoreductase [Sediminibacterium sp. Gen4]